MEERNEILLVVCLFAYNWLKHSVVVVLEPGIAKCEITEL